MVIPLLMRNFNEKSLKVSSSRVNPVSNYFPKEMENSLRKLLNSVDENNYILCPVYNNGDFQIGITGKSKDGEYIDETVERELYEELSISPQRMAIKLIKQFQKFTIYSLNVKDIKDFQEQNYIDTRRDNPYRKIGCFVYGCKKEILKFLCSDFLYNFPANDNIVGICAVNLKDLEKYINE